MTHMTPLEHWMALKDLDRAAVGRRMKPIGPTPHLAGRIAVLLRHFDSAFGRIAAAGGLEAAEGKSH
jgi:hypothetical protein